MSETDESARGASYHAAHMYDAAVQPRYAQWFTELLLAGVSLPPRAAVLDLACRTGEPALSILRTLGDGRLVAIDAEAEYVEVARARAGGDHEPRADFRVASVEALPFAGGTFTNVVGNLVDRITTDRGVLLAEVSRVLRLRGQCVFTMPLAGSFESVIDLMREVALKHELTDVADRVEQYAASFPTAAQWTDEMNAAGYEVMACTSRTFALDFASGEHLLSDPAAYFAALPEWQWCASGAEDATAVLYQVQDAVDTYFRGRTFEVDVVAGCLSARRQG